MKTTYNRNKKYESNIQRNPEYKDDILFSYVL